MQTSDSITTGGRSLTLYAKKLEKLGILTFSDLLNHFPSRYEDYSLISFIDKVQEGEIVTVTGVITSSKTNYTRSFKNIQKVTIKDDTGELLLVWFNQPYLTKNLPVDKSISVSGRVDKFSGKLAIFSPEYEDLDAEPVSTRRIVPIYPTTKGVSTKWLRKQIYLSLQTKLDLVEDVIPQDLLKKHNFDTLQTSIQEIHFPKNFETLKIAKDRLSFDELFLMQLSANERRKEWRSQKNGISLKKHPEELQKVIKTLPFSLTNSQEKALEDIFTDFTKESAMNRLLQGDVGSGKTIIASLASYEVFLNGYKSIVMAPTEILAQQHFATFNKLLSPIGLKVGLMTSSNKLPNPEEYDIVIGTHSVVSAKANFDKIGLVVIDEQQRFGVAQRGILRTKGENPHLLTMTATPIPRTVALTMYGDLDVSYLTDMPHGRLVIKTWLTEDVKRQSAYEWIRKEIQTNKTQAFIICPFIEESESMTTVKAATKEYEMLKTEVFPDLSLGLLHGKMKAKDKDIVLQEFRDKKYDILVSTPVVEVGIDIPNATIMVIEGAERFGLAQLHQLRGRVGRSELQSYCLLFTESKSEQGIARLKAMETMSDGAALAEFDLHLRGAGELFGHKQSGAGLLKVASFADTKLIQEAKDDAMIISKTIDNYPNLKKKVVELNKKIVNPD